MTGAQPQSLTNNARTIAVRTHGRYLINAREDATATLVGFHGYQENAAIHLDVLRRIARDRAINLVSIQALNRFYTRANAVVAGWMTSEDRELVITDNIAYVAAVLAEIAGEIGITRPLIYAGFSQGVAMAYHRTGRRRAAGCRAHGRRLTHHAGRPRQ